MATKKPELCAVCSLAELKSVVVRLGAYSLMGCAACGSWTLLPRLDPESRAALHDTESYFGHEYFGRRRQITKGLQRRVSATFRRIATMTALKGLVGERMLDVGCDTGEFLSCARDQFGILPIGIDVSSRAVSEANRKNIEAYNTDLQKAPKHLNKLALITAIDLIEHVADPYDFLQHIHNRLKPGGVAYLETPNAASVVYSLGRLLCRITGGNPRKMFERLFPVQHAQYFTRKALAELAAKSGFETLEIDTRVLPFRDISTSLATRLGLAVLQIADRFTGERILLCATLRKSR